MPPVGDPASRAGFPDRLRFTPVPDPFLRELLPQMDDLAEVKVTLLVFWAIYRKRGSPRFVAFPEVQQALQRAGMAEPEVRRALEQAVRRGTLLHLTQDTDGQTQDIYLVNNAEGRQALERGLFPSFVPAPELAPRPDIFTLYEEEKFGLLTPLIAEELKEAEKAYPISWIQEAMREAVRANRRQWRYVARILERWQQEGKDHGEPGGDPKAAREKYLRGKYGHLVQG